MGLFSKTPKPKPKVIVEGIEVSFHRDHEWWDFVYRGTEFCSFEPSLTLPTRTQLDSIVEALESLMPEMRARLMKGLSEWSESKLDDGESYTVNVQDFVSGRTFTVSWSGGATWGDLAAHFTVKDRAIVGESWGD